MKNKTKRLVIFCALAAACMLCASTYVGNYAADASESQQLRYEIEVGSAVTAPALLENDCVYKANLYADSDEAYAEPLCENFHATPYDFTQIANYRIKYFVTEVSSGAQSERFGVIRVVDTLPPSVTYAAPLPEFVEVGDTFYPVEVTCTDNSGGNISATRTVFFEGKDITESAKDGGYVFDTTGVCRVTDAAKDSSGNVGERSYEFNVVNKDGQSTAPTTPGKKRLGTVWIVLIPVISVIVVAGCAVAAYMIVKKRRNAQ